MFPPRTVLAAVDFSEPSRTALACAARFARQCRAELHVLHAQEADVSAAVAAQHRDLAAETREELRAFTSAVLPGGAPPPVHHVVVGPPTDVICNIADRERADLIVLGAHGMSGAGQPAFGVVTEGVLRCADVSVLVVPAAWTPPRADTNDLTGLGPLVVGLELSEPALGAAAAAGRLATAIGTTVELLHVVPAPGVLPRWSADAEAAVKTRVDAARRDLSCAVATLASDAASRVRVEIGAVASTLARIASPRGDNQPLLVLGRRTRADRCGAPGTIAYRLLMLAEVPVLVHLPDPES